MSTSRLQRELQADDDDALSFPFSSSHHGLPTVQDDLWTDLHLLEELVLPLLLELHLMETTRARSVVDRNSLGSLLVWECLR